ncbi:NAD(P)H-dependent oxidoreductase [Sphingobacterium alkalisoli]|uniref:NAD(P)H-dependent oxidoreductase n=1 Tax=Sphingobacterium alkalisoli TaxID=1874115 RepID=A0A4U0H1K9_9SPHI|nr:NAD(P)H-dependent oxidoreductase [Sphingobacterium alkalisoli]TJY65477.1 NAD(P)H-dependent oxidoreductase [Sphingobacterium alkalisoli]GGH20226.1 NAD(P)H dehydrogenase [Sphingobacterium alkalisoli]
MTKKIAVINGHPNSEAFNVAIAQAYIEAARASGAEVRVITVADLDFNPNLQYGYRKRMELEPDLLSAWETICWAEHLVWIHPVWWGGLPAITKGFIDRLFLPGMAFRYRDNSVWWDKLLKGKSARIITTLDQPGWAYRLLFGRPSVNQLKRSVLQFCGVTPVGITYLSVIRNSDERSRQKLLDKAKRLGAGLK